jgi:hypothetical protein
VVDLGAIICLLGHFKFFARLLPDTIWFIVRWMRLVVYSVYFAATLHGALCLVLIVFFARVVLYTVHFVLHGALHVSDVGGRDRGQGKRQRERSAGI